MEDSSVKSQLPPRSLHPSKLFVEPTTRCNFRCSMCLKQSGEQRLEEGDLSMSLFERLTDAFKHLEALVLTGMGEPLLHPGLEAMIALGRRHMSRAGWIGFQTNGALLSERRARSLIEAGTDKICVSVDSLSPAVFRMTRSAGEIDIVQRALRILGLVKNDLGANSFRVGIEFVLMRRNLDELPNVIEWAAEAGVSFVIATHLLPYQESMEEEALWPPNMDASIEIYREAQARANERGIDLRDYFASKAQSPRTQKEQQVVDLMGDAISCAFRGDVFMHIENLFEEDQALETRVADAFAVAEERASALGLELVLPALRPRYDRRCDFIETGSAFVSWQGNVHPCRFLWHRYSCFQKGKRKPVEPKSFGDLSQQSILEVWQSPAFVEFREAVLAYDYPHCGNCNVTPCDLISDESFAQDCYGCGVPCGHCPWSEGLLLCLS